MYKSGPVVPGLSWLKALCHVAETIVHALKVKINKPVGWNVNWNYAKS